MDIRRSDLAVVVEEVMVEVDLADECGRVVDSWRDEDCIKREYD